MLLAYCWLPSTKFLSVEVDATLGRVHYHRPNHCFQWDPAITIFKIHHPSGTTYRRCQNGQGNINSTTGFSRMPCARISAVNRRFHFWFFRVAPPEKVGILEAFRTMVSPFPALSLPTNTTGHLAVQKYVPARLTDGRFSRKDTNYPRTKGESRLLESSSLWM